MGQQNAAQKVLAWVLSVAVLGLITLNGWLVQTVMGHSKDIAVLSTGVHGRLDVLANEQARMARAQEDTAKELREMNSTLVGHISRSEITGETYGNQAKSKAGIH